MSYSGYKLRGPGRGMHGLGAGDSVEELARAATTINQTDHGQPWLLIGVASPEYYALRNKLNALGVPTGLAADGHASAEMGSGLGLWAAWLRFGRVTQWWLSALVQGEVLTDSLIVDWGRRLRVHPQLQAAILAGHPAGKTEPWAASSDGYVHVMGGSTGAQRDLLVDRIVGRLISGGYLPPLASNESLTQRTDGYFGPGNEAIGGSGGAFLGDRNPHAGLRLAFDDLLQAKASGGPDPGFWPGGIDFGATAGRELRIHPLLLKALFTTTLPGEVRMARARLTRLQMRRMVGGFPRVGGR